MHEPQQPRTRTVSPALALATALVLLAPTAAAGGHGSRPAEDYRELTSALESGDAGRASSIYEDAFAARARTDPSVASTLEDALSTVESAGPGSPEGQAAAETVEKGLLAVAVQGVRDAAANGSADEARAHFAVVEDGLGDEEPIRELAPAFENATSRSLPDAADRLTEAVRVVTLAETYHEVEETPELAAAGSTSEAAREAGEAAGYALGFRADLADALGEEAAGELDAELAELVEFAAAGEAETARSEADEILAILADYGIARAPQEKVEALETYEHALEEGNLTGAQATYNASFAGEAEEYADDAHRRVQDAFQALRRTDDEAERGVQVEVLEKTILDVAWAVGFHELAEGEVHEGLEWLAPLPATFGWYSDRPEQARALGHVSASGEAPQDRIDAMRDALAAHLQDKVREEVAEVFINWNDTATARTKAAEALLYARPAQDWFEAQLGEDAARELFDELGALANATQARERDRAREAGDEVETLLDKLAGGEGASDLEQLLAEVEDKIDFVAEEYRGYHEAREAGDSSEAETELGEARAFANRTAQLVEDNRALLAEANATALDELATRLDEVRDLLEATGSLDELTDAVEGTVALLDAFRSEEPEGPAVDVRVGPPEAEGDAFRVPVRLVGAPQDGYAFRANVTFDPASLEVRDVEVPAQIGAFETSEGRVGFNAAQTSVEGSEAEVAVLTVAAGPGEAADLDLAVDRLTDAEGGELTVGNVTGERLELAAADEADANATGPAATPGPGAVALLAALGLAALRRRP